MPEFWDQCFNSIRHILLLSLAPHVPPALVQPQPIRVAHEAVVFSLIVTHLFSQRSILWRVYFRNVSRTVVVCMTWPNAPVWVCCLPVEAGIPPVLACGPPSPTIIHNSDKKSRAIQCWVWIDHTQLSDSCIIQHAIQKPLRLSWQEVQWSRRSQSLAKTCASDITVYHSDKTRVTNDTVMQELNTAKE